jgi:hypothetical protein
MRFAYCEKMIASLMKESASMKTHMNMDFKLSTAHIKQNKEKQCFLLTHFE